MTTCTRKQFETLCAMRGYQIAQAMLCVVSEDGDCLTVDTEHAAYPRMRTAKGRSAPQLPPLLSRATNFAASAARHVAAGMPMASQEQINARYAICETCEFFQAGACSKCGCPLVRQMKTVSKLAWAGESCPVGKWGPVEPAT